MMDELDEHAGPDWSRTGLLKKCPRCGRIGTVYATPRPDDYSIVWPESPGIDRYNPDPVRIDICLSMEDLTRLTVGCGYDTVRRHK